MTTLCYNEGEMQTVHQEESIFQHCSLFNLSRRVEIQVGYFPAITSASLPHDNALRLTILASLPFKKGSPLRPVVG